MVLLMKIVSFLLTDKFAEICDQFGHQTHKRTVKSYFKEN